MPNGGPDRQDYDPEAALLDSRDAVVAVQAEKPFLTDEEKKERLRISAQHIHDQIGVSIGFGD